MPGTNSYGGRFLAVGRGDGMVGIIEMETRLPLMQLSGHVKSIVDVRWSRCGRYLLSASRDWNVIIWDLSTGDRRETVRASKCWRHNAHSKLLVVAIQNQEEAVLVDLRSEEVGGGRFELDPNAQVNGDSARKRRAYPVLVRFTPRGDAVYVATSSGTINIFSTQTKELLHTENVSGNSTIKQMEFDRRGNALAVNSNDRVIRVFAIVDNVLTLVQKFQDVINRTPWSGVGFSNSGDYICAGTGMGERTNHNIYIWHRTGTLAKILEGPKDPVEDFDWHPTRPMIASVSHLGMIHLWTTGVTERWAAYAPGFTELEENTLYFEKEDEFDLEDETIATRRAVDEQDAHVELNAPWKSISAQAADAFADVEPDDDTDPAFVPGVLDYAEAFGGEIESAESQQAAAAALAAEQGRSGYDDLVAAQQALTASLANGWDSGEESDASVRAAAFGTRKKRKGRK